MLKSRKQKWILAGIILWMSGQSVIAGDPMLEPVPRRLPVEEWSPRPDGTKHRTEESSWEFIFPDFYEDYLAGKLELGTRITYYKLTDTQRGKSNDGSFIGSITELEENQDYTPFKLYAQYKFLPFLGAGITYDRVRAVTRDGPLEENTDGTVDASGPIFYLTACYTNESRFTPFAELGLAYYFVDFDVDPRWSQNGLRVMKVKDTTGLTLALGCDIEVIQHVAVNAYFRYAHVSEIDTDFIRDGVKLRTGSFPISNYTFGLGVKFIF